MTLDRDETRSVFVNVSSEADQDRVIDALSPLDPTAGTDHPTLEVADQMVVPGQSALVSVISPVSVAEALRTLSFKLATHISFSRNKHVYGLRGWRLFKRQTRAAYVSNFI